MKIQEIKDKKIWEDFVTSQRSHSFLHSWAWGEFNKSTGDNIWRFGVENNEELIAVFLLIKVHAKRGIFLFIPQGPVVSSKGSSLKVKILEILTEEVKKIAKKEKDFATADTLRDTIKSMGYEVLDTPDGYKLRKL